MMKNLAIGFVIGYLLCTYQLGGTEAMAEIIGKAFTQISVWITEFKQSIG
jgi:hypothetical protein|tara:strand:+ start:667 stop:816 length:150 start_codon:yes stop_codon:yes gene_type:complete